MTNDVVIYTLRLPSPLVQVLLTAVNKVAMPRELTDPLMAELTAQMGAQNEQLMRQAAEAQAQAQRKRRRRPAAPQGNGHAAAAPPQN